MNKSQAQMHVSLILQRLWRLLPDDLKQFPYVLSDGEISVVCETEDQAQDIKNQTYVFLLDQARLLGFGRQIKEIVYAWADRPTGVTFPLNM